MATHPAATLTAPRAIAVEERPSPALAPWEVRVRIDLASVCGTDLALWSGDLPTSLPLVLGHEFVGTVVEVGDQRDEPWLGRRVCADINFTCLSRRESTPCRACRFGHPHHCQRRTTMGITEAPGAFAREMVVPAENLFALPDAVGDSQAVFVEPLAAAIQAFEQVPVGEGDVVVVLGLGRLGALVAAVAQRRGATVLAVGRGQAKINRAARLGVGKVLSVRSDDVRGRVRGQTENLGADVVVEATGAPEGLAMALDLVRPRGTVILKTTCGIPASGFDETRVVVDEITLVGSRCGPFGSAIELLARGNLPVETLIEETHPLAEIERALARASEVFKVAVKPG
ncbi:alcohol dehydrogenase catalytic domain-containing protein [Candidatus Sumerlaeota bacterium]|nr:alcohol dehydrogenase catalytic domain-containing protein [Candidatus Sumerlaeota bacterium]